MTPDDAVLAFHEELIARFPGLESLGVDDLDGSAWSMSPDATSSRVVLCMAWSRVAETMPFVLELAGRHGLVCFDPTAGVVHDPAVPSSGLRMEFCDGSVIVDPALKELGPLLGRLSPANWYAWLERGDGWFVQAGIGRNAGGVPDGKFALEYREGTADRHYRVVVNDLAAAVGLFEDFAAGRESFKGGFAWDEY